MSDKICNFLNKVRRICRNYKNYSLLKINKLFSMYLLEFTHFLFTVYIVSCVQHIDTIMSHYWNDMKSVGIFLCFFNKTIIYLAIDYSHPVCIFSFPFQSYPKILFKSLLWQYFLKVFFPLIKKKKKMLKY